MLQFSHHQRGRGEQLALKTISTTASEGSNLHSYHNRFAYSDLAGCRVDQDWQVEQPDVAVVLLLHLPSSPDLLLDDG